MSKKKAKRINITMTPQLLEFLDRRAAIYGMSRSGYIAHMLIEEMSDIEYEHIYVDKVPMGYGYCEEY